MTKATTAENPDGTRRWERVCALKELPVERGMAALIDRQQLAVFRLADDTVRAIANRDPFSGTQVLARGLIGDRAGAPIVVSPLYKQAFELATGRCLDDDNTTVAVYPAMVRRGSVWIGLPTLPPARAGSS